MKNFLKNLGIIIILIGVIILVIKTLSSGLSNAPLAIGGGLIVIGLIVQIVLGRYIE
ncbi:MAG TPA: hypothetical protein VJ937_04485 [Salinivirga sp.]|uniref:hypothetical protein n=1 Tax=Salinivirga sp. TaxID=1970192 RepID=UPI002B47E4AD|nr:hypothetical protein [Salinivirga sp.]HKK58710.1 hypothetical protein [Salinivirga sp.]